MLESQQPTCPQLKHIRRWAQVDSPSSAHSWHRPGVTGAGSEAPAAVVRWSHDSGGSGARRNMLLKDRHVNTSLLLVLVGGVLLAALARRYTVSASLVLVVAGLAIGLIPGVP